jgi:hypothetical protein
MFGDDQTKIQKQMAIVLLKFIKDLPMHKWQDALNTKDIMVWPHLDIGGINK